MLVAASERGSDGSDDGGAALTAGARAQFYEARAERRASRSSSAADDRTRRSRLSLSTGAEHPASASAACNLALMHKHCGEVDAAIGLYREASRAVRGDGGADALFDGATVASGLALLLRSATSAAAEEGVLAEPRMRCPLRGAGRRAPRCTATRTRWRA